MKRIGIIGCGTMGSAIARSLTDGALVYDSQMSASERLSGVPGITIAASLETLLKESETVLLAVKPQVLPSLYPALCRHDKLWISIAAGVSLSRLHAGLQRERLVRLMPNIAAGEKKSVTALSAGPLCSEASVAEATEIASHFGTVIPLEEHLFDGFIGISSSAIAFMLDFVHALSMGGVAEGIPYAKALEIVAATMGSTTALLASSACHPIALVSSVCSAGGTTIEGMEALADGAFEATVMAAVRASAEKNRTLEATALEHNNREDKQ